MVAYESENFTRKSFYRGVYQAEDGVYKTASGVEFQNTDKLPIQIFGKLRSRPHFIVRGYSVVGGDRKLERILADANSRGNLSREQVMEMVRGSIQNTLICETHDIDIEVSFIPIKKILT